MKRSVVIAGIVAVSLAVLPSAAFADEGPGAAVPAQPADCPSAPADPGGGSGTGEPATGGDRPSAGGSGEEPEGKDRTGGDGSGSGSGGSAGGSAGGEGRADEQPPGEQSGGEQSGGDEPGEDKSGGDKSGEDKSGEDKSAGDKTTGDKSGGDKSGGDEPQDKSAGDKSAGDKSGGDKSAGGEPGDKPGEDKAGGEPGDKAGDEPSSNPAQDPSGDEPASKKEPGACPAAEPAAGAAPAAAGEPAGAATSAAVMNKWGEPNRVDDFDGDLSNWSLYDGEGHAGNGRRSPDAASVKDGILTIDGDSEGTTAGMAWNPGQKYGRWEGRVRAPASDPTYNALLLLWPDAEDFPVGGEVDFMEMMDHTRQETNMFLHYGADNSQVQGSVKVDATQWHNWAVEWTPEKVTAFVDGKEWWSTDDTSILPPGPMHLCIQLDWFPGSGEAEVKPSKMEVDWVRQYALPESEQGGDGGKKKSEGVLDGVGGAVDDLVRRTEGAPDPAGSGQRGPSGTRFTGTP